MPQSSESIGALAAALAKAQSEIANPEKSLTATIVSPFPREGTRSFRYAPLSTGLDLVRKCLGQHEIATVQTTAIDQGSSLITLTTTLVHASGEWVSSEWPVCPASEAAAPHRLGTALTYARRYALFTLVGIAGEDDLDAPDLSPAHVASESAASSQASGSRPRQPEKGTRSNRPRQETLSAGASENIRRRLISEIEQLEDPDALGGWAHQALPLKNQLSTADAQAVETAFSGKMAQFDEPLSASGPTHQSANGEDPPKPAEEGGEWSSEVTVIRKPVRERDRNHLRFVASQPCLICGRSPSDPHHIKYAEPPAMGRKVSDRFTVPVCRLHHRELHQRGNERAWWQKQEIDPLPVAAILWARTHGASIETTMPAGPALANGVPAADLLQNDETKPIVRPGAS